MNNNPTQILLFGVTGDLVRRKVAKAMYKLFRKGKLTQQDKIIGFARRELDRKAFEAYLSDVVAPTNDKLFANFLAIFDYHSGDFTSVDAYISLATKVKSHDDKLDQDSNIIVYLATPPSIYEQIFDNLAEAGLTKENGKSQTKIIIEKPFGVNYDDAIELNASLLKTFEERQIHRIDHYFGKRVVREILPFRRANPDIESRLNNQHVESIHITLLETLDVAKRASFYDETGTLIDVGQNHMYLELGLITQELDGKREEVLSKQQKVEEKDYKTEQYDGYLSHDGVAEGSTTETYFELEGELQGDRWSGVKYTMKAGKKQDRIEKELTINFMDGSKLIISLEPKRSICIESEQGRNECLKLDDVEEQYTEEYFNLFSDIMIDDKSHFPSYEEILEQWRIISDII